MEKIDPPNSHDTRPYLAIIIDFIGKLCLNSGRTIRFHPNIRYGTRNADSLRLFRAFLGLWRLAFVIKEGLEHSSEPFELLVEVKLPESESPVDPVDEQCDGDQSVINNAFFSAKRLIEDKEWKSMIGKQCKYVVPSPMRCQMIHFICLLITAVVFGACSDSNESSDTQPDPVNGPKPVLWNFGVDFDRAFNLDDVETITYKFMEFGFEVLDSNWNPKPLPHFTYVLDPSIEVISPMEGVVEVVHLQDESTQDFAIRLMPRGDPTLWRVEFDHVTQVAVAVGDEVDIGDHLGYPSVFGTHGSFEFMVNGPDAYVCPFQVFDPAVAVELQAKLVAFMAAWDAAKWALPEDHNQYPGNPSGWYTPYDSVEMVTPGCRSWQIPYSVQRVPRRNEIQTR